MKNFQHSLNTANPRNQWKVEISKKFNQYSFLQGSRDIKIDRDRLILVLLPIRGVHAKLRKLLIISRQRAGLSFLRVENNF